MSTQQGAPDLKSFNWSQNANERNNENLMVIRDQM
jgi:hypothetical protein